MDEYSPDTKNGIALLLTVFILTAILSVSTGVFTALYGEILITDAVKNSTQAINGSDHGVERTLYRDRILAPLPNGATESRILPSGACYDMTTIKFGLLTQIRVVAEYTCGNPTRAAKRAFRVTY